MGEAPSITEEVGRDPHKRMSPSEKNKKKSAEPMKQVAGEVTTVKSVETRLHYEVLKGEEIGQELIKKEKVRTKKIMKISHFQAMALMGKVLFEKLKIPVPYDGKTRNSSSCDSYSSEEIESETLTSDPTFSSSKAIISDSSIQADLIETEQEKDYHEEEIDIDLNDPEVAASAAKIQAGFRGKKARAEVSQLKKEKQEGVKEVDEEIDIDLNDPEVAASAEKIQAGFRGNKARAEVSQLKKENQERVKETDTTKLEEKNSDNNTNTNDNDVLAGPEIDIDLGKPFVNNLIIFNIRCRVGYHQKSQFEPY